jgi:hypothetical protein
MTGRLTAMSNTPRPVRLKSPVTRAVVPVLGGLGFLAALGLVTWAIAAWISGGGVEVTDRLAPSRFEVGSTQNAAQIVAESGPIIFPGLNTTTGERTLVLDHQGDDPTRGWRIYYAYPVGRPDCPVEQVIDTGALLDCDGDPIAVDDLSPPESGVFPVVENQRILYIDLTGVTTGATTTTPG